VPIGLLVRRACHEDPGDDVIAAYDAPFPNAASKAGARAFPLILPQEPDAPGAAEGRRVLEALGDDRRPMLMLWGEEDPVLPPAAGDALARRLNRPPPERIAGASHFLQEDAGEQIGAKIADWLASA
jgi:haloalkane dehalogenase